VLVPNKNGKWRICVDYRELNKVTKKYHFPLPFIDQVLDGLVGKKFFSFLDWFNRYNQIHISPEDEDKTTFTILGVLLLVHDVVGIYMDDFTPYGCDFQEALSNQGKVLNKCIEMNLCLSPEKCEFLMTTGTVLDHSISQEGLQVDPNKIAIIKRVPTSQKQRNVRSFLGLSEFYRRFIKYFRKLTSPLFGLLAKDSEFLWSKNYQEAMETLKDKLTSTPIL